MPTQLIRRPDTARIEIRCDAADAVVANLAVNIVFFFEQRLDVDALAVAFSRALVAFPLFAGRMVPNCGRMRIRCAAQGVPFTSVTSRCSLAGAIRSVAQDGGGWLLDPVNATLARWGRGPLCTVRITALADGGTAIGFSWHHVLGDMQSGISFMNAWAAATGEPVAQPLIAGDRAAYLDRRLPPGGATRPGVRCLGLGETARGLSYLATHARRQRTLTIGFDDAEIARMREAYGSRIRLSRNDAVCAHLAEALMRVDPGVDRRTLAIAVNARTRYGLDPTVVGNVITTLNIPIRRGESPGSIAGRIRDGVDHFADRHNDMRANQTFFDGLGPLRAGRCVSTSFEPSRWSVVISNWSGFGLYRIQFEGMSPCHVTPVVKVPVPGLGVLVDGVGGRGLVFQIALPPVEFGVASSAEMDDYVHRFRSGEPAGDAADRYGVPGIAGG
jgi:hypothetical protein